MKVFISHKIRYNAMRLAKEGAPHSKSSLQYKLPKDIADDILNWSMNNVPEEELYTEEEDMGREDDIHVTVFYGILDEDSKDTSNVLEEHNIKPFPVRLSTITAFQNKPEYDVLKVDVESSELHKIHRLIEKYLDTESTYPEYKPHLTIAYLKKGYADKYTGRNDFQGISMIAESLEFSSKNGTKTNFDLKK